MDSSDPIVIRTEGLSKSYKNVTALKPLDVKIPRNSIIGVLGPNGAGKTTTIKLLLGLTRPTSGSGTVFGHDIVRDGIEIRRRVGYLAQDPRYYDRMSARETLRFKARFYFAGPKDEIEKRVAETLDLVGLSDKADRPTRGFSGGERQRLGIGQALINSPDLLILDEPAASLDPMGRRDVLDIIQGLRHKTTVFYSTHILSDVERVSDAVGILNHGELIAQAPIETLLAGTGGIIYTVIVKGDAGEAHARVSGQEWVSGIDVAPADGQATWQVSVTDEAAAEAQLLRLVLADEHTIVAQFGRKKYELEEVFMQIVEGGSNG